MTKTITSAFEKLNKEINDIFSQTDNSTGRGTPI